LERPSFGLPCLSATLLRGRPRRTATRFVQQEHRDVITDFEDAPALRTGQRGGFRVVVEWGVMRVRTREDLQQLRVQGHEGLLPPRAGGAASTAPTSGKDLNCGRWPAPRHEAQP